MAQSEPGITASAIGGAVAIPSLGLAGYDALIELGWGPKSAMFVVLIASSLVSLGAAWWARRNTVTREAYNAANAVSLALPSDATPVQLNQALAAQPEPLPAVTPAPVIEEKPPESRPRRVEPL